MAQPLVSVIMPVYNAEKYVSLSLLSILHQTYSQFELIVVNDGSTDTSNQILKPYLRSSKLHYFNHPKNLGGATALNTGLAHARGKYIAIQDADDISLPNRLQDQVAFLETHPTVFLCAGNADIITPDGTRLGTLHTPSFASHLLPLENHFIHPSLCYRQPTQDDYYRPKFKRAFDYDFLLRLYSQRKKFAILQKTLIQYRLNPTGLTLSCPTASLAEAVKIKSYYFQRLHQGNDTYSDDTLTPHLTVSRISPHLTYRQQENYLQLLLRLNNRHQAYSYYHHALGQNNFPVYKKLLYSLALVIPAFFSLAYQLFLLTQLVKLVLVYKKITQV